MRHGELYEMYNLFKHYEVFPILCRESGIVILIKLIHFQADPVLGISNLILLIYLIIIFLSTVFP